MLIVLLLLELEPAHDRLLAFKNRQDPGHSGLRGNEGRSVVLFRFERYYLNQE